jgi:tetratricopeptide (TPR) repeat protein
MAQGNHNSQSSSAKTLDRKRRLAECYQRGIHLSAHDKNYDYAHAVFAECVLNDPGNLQFVEAMVKNLRASKPEHKKSPFKLGRGGSRALAKLVQQKAWADVLRTGIELLKADPWDVTTLHAMAEACAALHHNEVELVYLKQALDAEPKNVEVNRHCARSLARMGQFDQAIACWHRVETLRGKDAEASKQISFLAQEKIMYPGGRPPAAPVKEIPTAAEPAQEQTPQAVLLTPQQRLEQAIAQDPKEAANYLELADLLLRSNRFDAAEAILSRAVTACGEQQVLSERLNRVRHLRAEEQRMLAEERAAEQQLINAPIRVPWLELGLATGVVALAAQLIPAVRTAVLTVVDFRHWSQSGWMVFNIAVLLGLIAARFLPQLRGNSKRRQIRRKLRLSGGQR